MYRSSTLRARRVIIVALVASACGAPPKAAAPKTAPPPSPPVTSSAAPEHPEPPAHELRTGRLASIDDPKIELKVLARARVGESELIEAALPETLPQGVRIGTATSVALTPGDGSLAFVTIGGPPVGPSRRALPEGGLRLWVRRPSTSGGLAGTLSTPADMNYGTVQRGHRIPFVAAVDASAPASADLERRWALALASTFDAEPGAFYRFAAARLRQRYAMGKEPALRGSDATRRQGDLAELMDTMTGRLSVQEALQRDRSLFLEASRQKASVPLASLRQPALSTHPWADLLRALGKAVPEEPFAKATPAEFYFVRARSLTALLDLVDAVEDWGQPAADLLDGRSEDRGTFARYQTELGLERSAATRVLGPELVQDLAMVGSDPYVHEGTDVTLLLHVKNEAVFQAAVAAIATKLGGDHGGANETSFVHEGVTVTVRRTPDGAVRQHVASDGGVVFVSNSPGAIRRALTTAHGHHARLADQPDFAYMLARDADASGDVLAYLGDAFIGAVAGPEQKIGEARRQLSLAELSAPGYASLLHGFVYGKAPASSKELVQSKLLEAGELAHRDRAPIEWNPATGARSKWGTPAALEPLIDLPRVTAVTPAEQRGYESFAREYEFTWSDKIDPVALRAGIDKSNGHSRLSFDMRVLPLLRREYSDLLEMAGSARVNVPELGDGTRIVVGIGKDAALRRELTADGQSFGLGSKFALDWLGDYAMLGAANRNGLSNAVLVAVPEYIEMPPETLPPRRRAFAGLLRDLPVYAAIQIKSRVAAGIALGLLREAATREARGLLSWSTAPAYRGSEVTAVTGHEDGGDVTLYYALTNEALVFALSESALHFAIDSLHDAPPSAVDPRREDRAASQATFELTAAVSSPLYRALAWAGTAALLEAPNEAPGLAEAILRGDPKAASDPARARALSRAVFGVVPLTLEGQPFALGPDGLEFPPRGTANSPIWPSLPVQGSPLEKILSKLARLRTALAFDDEPGATQGRAFRSLHARATFDLR